MKLFLNALTKFLLALVFVVVLLVVPAGGFDYINGWIFVFMLFVPVMIMGGVLLFKAPGLLEKRLNIREKEKTQKESLRFLHCFFLQALLLRGLIIASDGQAFRCRWLSYRRSFCWWDTGFTQRL